MELEINNRIFTKTNYYIFKDGALYKNVAAGQIKDGKRVYRKAGRYNLYVDSFSNAALPYSKYYIADTISGIVYEAEILHGFGASEEVKEIVKALKRM